MKNSMLRTITLAAALLIVNGAFAADASKEPPAKPAPKAEEKAPPLVLKDQYDETDELAVPIDSSEAEDEEELEMLQKGDKNPLIPPKGEQKPEAKK